MSSEYSNTLCPTPDYVLALKDGHPVLVPISADMRGGPSDNQYGIVVGPVAAGAGNAGTLLNQPYSAIADYNLDSVGEELQMLDAAMHTLIGTDRQIIITPAVVGNTLTLSAPQNLDTTSDPVFRYLGVRSVHGSSAAPTVVLGAGAGTDGSLTVTGDGVAFTVQITSGATPTTNAVAIAVTFATPFNSVPVVIPVAQNPRAAALQGAFSSAMWIGSQTANGFVLNTGAAVAPAAATAYTYSFLVFGGN